MISLIFATRADVSSTVGLPVVGVGTADLAALMACITAKICAGVNAGSFIGANGALAFIAAACLACAAAIKLAINALRGSSVVDVAPEKVNDLSSSLGVVNQRGPI